MYDLLFCRLPKDNLVFAVLNISKLSGNDLNQQDIGQMFFACFEGQIIAGAYAMVFGKKSTYKDGASVRKKTTYGASHLLQWRVIEWAKSMGATLHDFCGSPPSEEINNPDHPHYGIGLFKTSFSKHVVDYVGCYDFVINPTKYKIWIKFGEKVATSHYTITNIMIRIIKLEYYAKD